MRIKPDRSHYIPREGATEHKDTESTAVAYTYESRGEPVALGFSGKRQKPDFHIRFRSEERRAAHIERHREQVRRNEAYQAERKAQAVDNRRKASALDFAGKDYLSCADTAALCRRALAEAFPGQKFSVRSDGSLRVEWVDGPSLKTVEAIADTFAGSYFDGMIDYRGSIYHNLDGRRVHFGADFVFCNRTLSAEAYAVGLAAYEAAEPSRAGAVKLGEVDRWGRPAFIVDSDHGQVLAGRYPGEFEIECAPGSEVACSRFAEPSRALATWFDHARPVKAQPSPTFARVTVAGSDGYGQSGLEPADGGDDLRGYPRPKEPEPDAAAVQAADDLAAELAASGLLAEFLARWQPTGRAH